MGRAGLFLLTGTEPGPFTALMEQKIPTTYLSFMVFIKKPAIYIETSENFL
jgi:Tfp pilus assembly protein PilZ